MTSLSFSFPAKRRLLPGRVRRCSAAAVVALALSAMTAAAQTADLLISEYVEGSGDNKAIEIYNGTGAAVDLGADEYRLEIYFNDNDFAETVIDLTGFVAADSVLPDRSISVRSRFVARSRSPSRNVVSAPRSSRCPITVKWSSATPHPAAPSIPASV